MALLKPIGQAVGGVLKALGVVSTPKPAPVAAPTITTDDAAAAIASDDALRKRRGGASDILTGAQGIEAPLTGGKLTLGS